MAAANRFLAKTLRSNKPAGYPRVSSTDKAPSLARALAELGAEGIYPPPVEHRWLKRILGPMGGVQKLRCPLTGR